MRNLTLTIHFCDISQSFVSATKYENTSSIIVLFSLNFLYPQAAENRAMEFSIRAE
jgi:hypothetical protein